MEQRSFNKMVTNMLKEFDQAEFLHDLYHITQAPLTEHQKYISLEMMIKKEYEDKNKRRHEQWVKKGMELRTLGVRMRSETSEYNKEQQEDKLRHLFDEHPECESEFAKVLTSLHENALDGEYFTLLHSDSDTIEAISTRQIPMVRKKVNIDEIETYSSGLAKISYELLRFIEDNKLYIADYFGLTSIGINYYLKFEERKSGTEFSAHIRSILVRI